jgi:hypothetical protein
MPVTAEVRGGLFQRDRLGFGGCRKTIRRRRIKITEDW